MSNEVTECDSFYTQGNRPEEFRESLNETSSNSEEEHNTGKIVGGVLGAVASVILVLGLVIMVACKKCYSQEGHEETESEVFTVEDQEEVTLTQVT
ncbi:uncharacterized protein LOC112567932 isoform X2 [Pomacea canaliculata]|uniref:uncharacterized protein LOC112567932 isoform X2 n=1 Tax=Pomacea canaliculata TaxID=400727 RepID=UPI000D72A9C6|nr:uncharacterized protein LOC112567932 isoform X2 [Pomacea canaliculata]